MTERAILASEMWGIEAARETIGRRLAEGFAAIVARYQCVQLGVVPR